MNGFHPLALAILIVAVVSLAGMITTMLKTSRKFRGYETIAKDARALAGKLKGELFRDGDDLVISGMHQHLPTIIRLSHAESTPGVSIDIKVPAHFKFSLTPKQSETVPAGTAVNVPNLAANFAGRTDSPLEASQLISSPSVRKALSGICWSQKVFLELSPGRLLLNELLIPPNLRDRISDELDCVSVLVTQLRKFPGADTIKIAPIQRERTSWMFRGALAAGVLVTVAGVTTQNALNASSQPSKVVVAEENAIAKNDAILMPRIQAWKLAEDSDFDSEFQTWLGQYGYTPSNIVEFSSDSSRAHDGKAYFLVDAKGEKRVAVIVDHRLVYDAVFPTAAGIAAVPMDSVDKVEWPGSRPPFPKVPGDGLLVVRKAGHPDGAILLFFPQNNVYSGVPQDYQHLDIQLRDTTL